MAGQLSFDELKTATAAGEIDTVLACIIDMQGRLAGKRFHAEHFSESAWEETPLLQLSARHRSGDGDAGGL